MPGNISAVIHGHFYQPPRENPWTQKIPLQENARPHHDWNERITAECYNPNTRSRVIDPHGKIVSVVNNYSHFSFNIGPTLFSWIEKHHPDTYRRILEADRRSVEQFDGHGNAIAQVYNHIILPLANRRDKLTQIRWGIREFQHRYKRKPEAIWLAETAINQDTVECLIDEGMTYVILAPTQAQRVRRLDGQGNWWDVSQNSIDTRQPYRLFSRQADAPSERDTLRRESASFRRPTPGLATRISFRERLMLPIRHRVRSRWNSLERIRQKERQPVARREKTRRQYIDVFFYDGALAAEVSFQHLLQNARNFAQRVRNAAGHVANAPALVHFATDGEVYGHHEPFADMCAAHAILHEFPSFGIELTNYGQFLAQHPPTMEVELKRGGQADEGTAWSCSHGVGRWYRSCGCQIGNMPGWNQQWRTPLRNGLNHLRDVLAEMFEFYVGRLLRDPWNARDGYIECLLNPSPQTIDSFLTRFQTHPLNEEAQTLTLRCMEAQKYMMFAYTSCAWFFDDISGIEVRQNLRYAARAIQLMEDLFPHFATHHPDPTRRDMLKGKALEDLLLDELLHARSNIPGVGNGKDLYWKHVKPEIFTPEHAANHFLLEQLLERVYQTASTFQPPAESDTHHERQIYLYRARFLKSFFAENCPLPVAMSETTPRLPHELTQTGHHKQQHTVCSGLLEIRDTTTRQQWMLLSIGFMRESDQPVSYLKPVSTPTDWEEFETFLLPYFFHPGLDSIERFEQELRSKGFRQYGFHDLYAEDRERFFYRMAQHGVHRLETHLHAIYEDSRRFLAGLTALRVGIPEELRPPIEFALSYRLRQETEKLPNTHDVLSPTRLSAELEELLRLSATHHIALDKTLLQQRLSETLDAYISNLGTLLQSCASPQHLQHDAVTLEEGIHCIQETIGLLTKSREFGLSLNTTETQNRTFEIFQENLLPFFSSYYRQQEVRVSPRYRELIATYLSLLDQLNFDTEQYKSRLTS